MYLQVMDYLSDNNQLSPHQQGFRKNILCETQFLHFVTDCMTALTSPVPLTQFLSI